MTDINIEFANPVDADDVITHRWRLQDTPVAARWLERLVAAQSAGHPIDDPGRFYGFDSPAEEQANALARIQYDIATINSHQHIIQRELVSLDDQDTLNYLHHIFEVYHGLLDQQNTPYWQAAPVAVRQALARLNIDVHRAEDAGRNVKPKFICTYYGLPKDTLFEPEDFYHISNQYRFGDLTITYAEIGKTLADMCHDRDTYIHPEAFQPYQHISADFGVGFEEVSIEDAIAERLKVWHYFHRHRKKFEALGCTYQHPQHQPGKIVVADLIYTDKGAVLDSLKTRQRVNSVTVKGN